MCVSLHMLPVTLPRLCTTEPVESCLGSPHHCKALPPNPLITGLNWQRPFVRPEHAPARPAPLENHPTHKTFTPNPTYPKISHSNPTVATQAHAHHVPRINFSLCIFPYPLPFSPPTTTPPYTSSLSHTVTRHTSAPPCPWLCWCCPAPQTACRNDSAGCQAAPRSC